MLKFVPQSDVTVIDPVWSTTYVSRNHGYLIFDTLFGMDSTYQIQPQMVAGAVTENDGKLWKLTLRDGLVFHDGQKVTARDCIASIRRWAARDALGGTMMATTDELSAPDDRARTCGAYCGESGGTGRAFRRRGVFCCWRASG